MYIVIIKLAVFSQNESLFVACRQVHFRQELRPAVMIAQKGACMGIGHWPVGIDLATGN